MSFPTTGILDAFTRADENPLAGGWASVPVWNGDSVSKLVSNQMAPIGTSPSDNDAVWNTSFGADQEMYVTIVNTSGLTVCGLYGRLTAENDPAFHPVAYIAEFNLGASTVKLFRKNGAAASVQLGSTVTSFTVSNGDVLGLSCIGSTITIWRNGTSVISQTDTVITAGGKLGINMSVSSTSPRLDDFGGGDYIPPAAGGHGGFFFSS